MQLVFGASVAPLKDTDRRSSDRRCRTAARAVQIARRGNYQSCRQIVSKGNAIQRQVLVGAAHGEVRLVVPFSGMVAAPNAFAMVGGLMTVILAEEVLPLPASVERIWTLLV